MTNSSSSLNSTSVNITFIDPFRQAEVDSFYQACQLHRDQYKDHDGRLHALDFFAQQDYAYQCPPELTKQYMKYPIYFTKYRDPIVLPRTLEKTSRFPDLPERSLRGRYMKMSDMTYKR